MRQKMFLFVFTMLMATGLTAQDTQQSEADQLLDLLVAKNVITPTEASEFRATLKKRAAPSADTVAAQSPAEQFKPDQSANIQAAAHPLLNIRGVVQSRFTEGPGTNNTFEIRRARLAFEGKLTSNIAYELQIDAAEPQLLNARIDFNPVRQFRVRIGQFNVPFSTESYTSESVLGFVERSTVVNSLAPGRDNGSNGRDIGIQLSGKVLQFRGVDRLEYFVGVFNGAGINTKDDNPHKDAAVRLVFRPLKRVALGGNYYNGVAGAKELGKERADVEANFIQGPFSAAAEYLWGHDGPIHRYGWYAQSGYHAGKRWEALFRFDKFNPRQHTSKLTAVHNYVIGANYFLNSYVRLQANYDRQQDLITRHSANVVVLQTQFQFGREGQGDERQRAPVENGRL